MATESKASVGKVKSSNQASSSKGKPDSSSLNKKKIDSSIKQPPKSSSALTKTEVPISNLVAFFSFIAKKVTFFFLVWFDNLVILVGGILFLECELSG